jgi:PAS domain S-box-containing protein
MTVAQANGERSAVSDGRIEGKRDANKMMNRSRSSSGESVGESLWQTEAQFHELVEGVRDYAIFLLDSEGLVISWNEGAERIKGYRAEEIIGKHFSIFYPADSIRKGLPEHELKTAREEGRVEDEGWRLRKDGSCFWANVIITALCDQNGAIVGFLKITRDLTARKQTEEQHARLIREQTARAEAENAERRALFLAKASQALGNSLDEKQIYTSVARAAVPFLADICLVDRLGEDGFARLAALSQYKRLSADLSSILSTYYPISPGDSYLVSEVLRTGETRIFGDISKFSKNAIKFFAKQSDFILLKALSAHSAIVVPLVNQGEVFGTMSFVLIDPDRDYDATDITLAQDLAKRVCTSIDHALLYASAQDAQRKAEAASKAKDRFLAMLSHELRTPLMPILFSSALSVEDPEVPEKIREHLRTILKNAELEARLIDDLLDVTRIGKGKLQLNFAQADAHEALRNAVETCSSEIAGKQLLVSVNLSATHYRLHADIDRLQQVFWNLLKNAIKFTPPQGRIAIRSMNLRSTLLRIEIEDSGKGISPEIASKIFDLFEQGEGSEGLGLGLTISKSIVELHGGRITASSAGTHRGALFVIELPAAPR